MDQLPLISFIEITTKKIVMDSNRFHNPAIWRRLMIACIILIFVCIGVTVVIVVLEVICFSPSQNQIIVYFDDNQTADAPPPRLPQPQIWPFTRSINFPVFYRTKRFGNNCEYYTVFNNFSDFEDARLISQCQVDNANERIFLHESFFYSGKSLTVFAPGYGSQAYYGSYCNIEIAANASTADIVLINSQDRHELFENIDRPPQQIWIMQFMESPEHTKNISIFNEKINYTASYRSDADIITKYGGYRNVEQKQLHRSRINYEKPSRALWVASNCWTSNARKQLAEQISRHYKIDIFGSCGSTKISNKVLEEISSTNYRYYLSFENSNCKEYITEKVFQNAFKYDLIPIVYGASKADYKNALPPNSFIYYGDFTDAAELAQYLHQLDGDNFEYSKYFAWKSHYTPLNFNIFERLCSIHTYAPAKIYHDVDGWWNAKKCKRVSENNLWLKEPHE